MKPAAAHEHTVTDILQWTEAIWLASDENARAQKIGSRRVTAAITGMDGDYLTLHVHKVETLSIKPGTRYDELTAGDDILRKRAALGHSHLMRAAAAPAPLHARLLAKITPQHLLILFVILALFTVPPVMQQFTGTSDISQLQKRAEQGEVEAQDSLAWSYLTTPGVKRKYAKAAKWYGEAAEHGYAPSEYHLGTLVVEGHPGVPRDTSGAAKLWRASAEQGDEEAEVALASLYLEGKGVAKNAEEAYFWAALAVRAGDDGASAFRDRIAASLTPPQIAAAERRVAAWKQTSTPLPPESRDPVKPGTILSQGGLSQGGNAPSPELSK